MNDLIEVQKKIIPQAMDIMAKRYYILKQISMSEPIGRRILSTLLDLSERTTRTEIDFLKKQSLIYVDASGMSITEEGRDILEKLDLVMDEIMGISELERRLKETLGVNKVVISKNINDNEIDIKKELSKKAAEYLIEILGDKDIVAISGGTTMKSLVSSIEGEGGFKNVTVVPTRGSLGSDIDLQANSIAASLAKNLGGRVEFLYVPDQLDKEAKNALLKVPDVKKTLDDLSISDKMIFSFGRADIMARRRGMDEAYIEDLKKMGAIGEVFGHYFDEDGNVVTKLDTVGIDMDMYKNSKNAIVVFSGEDKVDSFLALCKINKNLSVITDEKSAKKVLKKVRKKDAL